MRSRSAGSQPTAPDEKPSICRHRHFSKQPSCHASTHDRAARGARLSEMPPKKGRKGRRGDDDDDDLGTQPSGGTDATQLEAPAGAPKKTSKKKQVTQALKSHIYAKAITAIQSAL